MTAKPILRALPENGPSCDDPEEADLFRLLQQIEAGDGTFLIVKRTIDPTGQTYAQALRSEEGCYIVEHREGNPRRHYGTVVADMQTAHALLAGWAFEVPGWDEQTSWSPVDA